jgi:hypothetical protein
VAYSVGFAVYWAGWCFAFPAWILGPHRIRHAMVHGRSPAGLETAVLLLPPLGAAATRTVAQPDSRGYPDRRSDGLHGPGERAGEELLWREMFVEEFPDDVLRGALWPLVGFALWHLAPQIILPSRRGRWPFLAGATVVGAASTFSAWRSGGIRNCLVPHAVPDSCGVTAARFRLGKPPYVT